MAAGCAGPPPVRACPPAGRLLGTTEREIARMIRHHYAVVAALAAGLALAEPASAQQPAEQRRVDSLAAEVRALKARLDSVRAQLAHRPVAAEPAADTSLAALRPAAAAAPGTGPPN